jgi:hypothetical protein
MLFPKHKKNKNYGFFPVNTMVMTLPWVPVEGFKEKAHYTIYNKLC